MAKLRRPGPDEVTAQEFAERAGVSLHVLRRMREKGAIKPNLRLFAGTDQAAWFFNQQALDDPEVTDYLERAKLHSQRRWGDQSRSAQGQAAAPLPSKVIEVLTRLQRSVDALTAQIGELARIIESRP